MQEGAASSNEEVKLWLLSTVGLPQYYDIFESNGFSTMQMIKEINGKEDLEYIGVKLKAHQIKIMNYIEKLQ